MTLFAICVGRRIQQNHVGGLLCVVPNLTIKPCSLEVHWRFFQTAFSVCQMVFLTNDIRYFTLSGSVSPTCVLFTGPQISFSWTLMVKIDAYHFSFATRISWARSALKMFPTISKACASLKCIAENMWIIWPWSCERTKQSRPNLRETPSYA